MPGNNEGAVQRLLLVDDDANVLRDVAASLSRSLDVIIEPFVDATQALHRARQTAFAAAVLDMDMPGLNGLQLARALRQVAADLPIFFLSGSMHEFPRGEIDAVGPAGVMTKPVKTSDLVARLSVVLGG